MSKWVVQKLDNGTYEMIRLPAYVNARDVCGAHPFIAERILYAQALGFDYTIVFKDGSRKLMQCRSESNAVEWMQQLADQLNAALTKA
jgi:hypothetical protein